MAALQTNVHSLFSFFSRIWNCQLTIKNDHILLSVDINLAGVKEFQNNREEVEVYFSHKVNFLALRIWV